MKKKLFFLTFIFIISIFFTSTVNAYSFSTNTFRNIDINKLKEKKWITNWPTNEVINGSSSSNSEYTASNNFRAYSVTDNANTYVLYSLFTSSIGSEENNIPLTGNYNMIVNNGFAGLSANLTDNQKELLKQLYANGYYPSTNTISLDSILEDRSSTLSLMAMQILTWEITSGGRTGFSSNNVNPNDIQNNFYKKIIYPNGGGSSSTDTLYYYYSHIVKNVAEAIPSTQTEAFNQSTYIMHWDVTKGNYVAQVDGLGKYDTCVSNNPNVKITSAGSSIVITSNDRIETSKVVCGYFGGSYSGINGVKTSDTEEYHYFTFENTLECSHPEDTLKCQNLVFGKGYKLYQREFDLVTEFAKVKINKVGIDNKQISGTLFKLTNRGTSDYNVFVDGNGKEEVLTKSGEYIVSEFNSPADYEKLSDFKLKINAQTKKVSSCDSEVRDTNGQIIGCLNKQVSVSYSGDTIVLTIVNVAKNFKIFSVGEDGSPIKGNKFQIKNSKDELMKFKQYDGNIFGYSSDGTITDIVLDNTAIYPIALLPEGEYKLIQISTPEPYKLSSDENNRIRLFKVNHSKDILIYDNVQKLYVSSSNDTVQIENYKTKVGFIVTGNGLPINGALFKLYKEDKVTEVSTKLNNPGKYEFTTDGSNNTTDYITNSEGQIIIENLPIGKYYLRQISTTEGNVLPEGEFAYTEFTIDINSTGHTVNNSNNVDTFNISNTKNSFNFYKQNKRGETLKTGKYKLQRLDGDKYKDIYIKSDGNRFTEDSNGRIQFTIDSGFATFYNMPEGKYRIIEIEAPEGYERAGSKDTANVTIDSNGYAKGLLVLKNRAIVDAGASASAELVISISTGQKVIKYGLIIVLLISAIGGLMIFLKKRK